MVSKIDSPIILFSVSVLDVATDVSTTAAVVITIGLSTQMSMVGVLLGSTLGSIVAAVLLVLCISMIICYIRMLRKRKRLWRITQVCKLPVNDDEYANHMTAH